MKIPEGYFKQLNSDLQCGGEPGSRIFAIDGSKVHVHPSYTSDGYKSTLRRDGTRRLMLLSSALDVDSRTCFDVQMSKDFDARACAKLHMQTFTRGDTMIFDRGYLSLSMLRTASEKGIKAVFRVRSNACRSVKFFYNQPATYRRVMLINGGTMTLMWLYKYHIDGVKYVCATNFDSSVKKVRALYKLRWRVESSFKRLKSVLNLENSHSRTPAGFMQEVEARILFDTVCVNTARATDCSESVKGYLVAVDLCNTVCKVIMICSEVVLPYKSFLKILIAEHSDVYYKLKRKVPRVKRRHFNFLHCG
jgi:hypothetical protein